jgi:hypothetical protein
MSKPRTLNPLSKKAFREWMNREYADSATHRHHQYAQRTRGYGDYLYFQDREKFEVEYVEWLAAQSQRSPSRTPA